MIEVGKTGNGAHLARMGSADRGRVIWQTDDGGCYEDPPGVSMVCPA
jgi:hypothetical protein